MKLGIFLTIIGGFLGMAFLLAIATLPLTAKVVPIDIGDLQILTWLVLAAPFLFFGIKRIRKAKRA